MPINPAVLAAAARAGGGGQPAQPPNRPGFFGRALGDTQRLVGGISRGLFDLFGGVISDFILEPIRTVIPGGDPGWFETGPFEATRRFSGAVGGSLLRTGQLVSDIGTLGFLPGGRERLSSEWQRFLEEPVSTTVEHVGNVALVGAAAGVPLRAASLGAAGTRAATTAAAREAARAARQNALAQITARAAEAPVRSGLAGAATRAVRGVQRVTVPTLAGRTAARAVRRQAVADVLASGGPGSGLARAAQISGDIIGHPYRFALRQGMQLPVGRGMTFSSLLDDIRNRPRWEKLRNQANFQADQIAAMERRLREDVARFEAEQAGTNLGPGQLPMDSDRLLAMADDIARRTDDLNTRKAEFAQFRDRFADDIARASEPPVHPLSRTVAAMRVADPQRSRAARLLQALERRREQAPVRQRVQEEARLQFARANREEIAGRMPGSRRDIVVDELRRAARAGELERLGITDPMTRVTQRMRGSRQQRPLVSALTDQDLYDTLVELRRAADEGRVDLPTQMPRIAPIIDNVIIDTYERLQGLPMGAVWNQAADLMRYGDLELVDRVRRAARALEQTDPQAAQAWLEGNQRLLGVTADLPEAARWENLPPEVQRAWRGAIDQYKRDVSRMEISKIDRGAAREKWGTRVQRWERPDGSSELVPLAVDQRVRLDLAGPSKRQARLLRSWQERVKTAKEGLGDLLERHARGNVLNRRDIAERLNEAWRALENIERKVARDLDDYQRWQAAMERAHDKGLVPPPVIKASPEQLADLLAEVRLLYAEAGLKPPKDITGEGITGSRLERLIDELADPGDPVTFERRPGAPPPERTAPDFDPTLREGLAERIAAARQRDMPRLAVTQDRARQVHRTLERAIDRFDQLQRRLADLEREVRTSMEAAPAMARPYMYLAREAAPQLDAALREAGLVELADDLDLAGLPKTLEAMEEAGVDLTYLRDLEQLTPQTGIGYRSAREEVARHPTPSFQRRRQVANMALERSMDATVAAQMVENAADVIKGEVANWIESNIAKSMDEVAALHYSDLNRMRVADRLDPSEAAALGLRMDRVIDAEAWSQLTKSQKERVLNQLGYVQYDPTSIFTLRIRRTSPSRKWIPKHMVDAIKSYQQAGMFEKFISRVLQPATTLWKNGILAFRPGWHVYNAIGSPAMMLASGAIGPGSYLKQMLSGLPRQLLDDWQRGFDLERWGLTRAQADELFGEALTADLNLARHDARLSTAEYVGSLEAMREQLDRVLRDEAKGAGQVSVLGDSARTLGQRARDAASTAWAKATRGTRRAAGVSYRANSYVDNLNRAALFLENAPRMGVEEALHVVGEVLGDYRKLTHFERLYVRSVWPFYAWVRHISGLTLRMLKPDSITRTVITGHIMNLLGEPDEFEALLPGYASGDIRVGESPDGIPQFLSLRGFNPWMDVFDPIIFNDQLSTRGAFRIAHPVLQFGAERLLGVDVTTMRPFSRPVPVLDAEGNEIPTPPPLLTHLADRFLPPQVPALTHLVEDFGRDLLGMQPAVRLPTYGSGEPIAVPGARGRTPLQELMALSGFNIREIDVERLEERRQRQFDRAIRLQERYAEELQARIREQLEGVTPVAPGAGAGLPPTLLPR